MFALRCHTVMYLSLSVPEGVASPYINTPLSYFWLMSLTLPVSSNRIWVKLPEIEALMYTFNAIYSQRYAQNAQEGESSWLSGDKY